jgi:hypothetical protein
MSMLSDFITAIDKMVPGTLPLDDTFKEVALGQAIEDHSKNKPQIVVEDLPGDGGFNYSLGLFLLWSEGFSGIKKVEYPADDNKPEINTLKEMDWSIYQSPTATYLRFLHDRPEEGEAIRVTYSAPHAITDLGSTIAAFDEKSLQVLAAGFFCEMLSTYFAQNQDSTIQADSVSHTSKSRDYAARAVVYRKIYFDHLGIKEGETLPASVTHNQSTGGSWAGDKITHPQRYR